MNFYTILLFNKFDIAFMQKNENKLSLVIFLFYGSSVFQDRYFSNIRKLSPVWNIKNDMVLCKI